MHSRRQQHAQQEAATCIAASSNIHSSRQHQANQGAAAGASSGGRWQHNNSQQAFWPGCPDPSGAAGNRPSLTPCCSARRNFSTTSTVSELQIMKPTGTPRPCSSRTCNSTSG
jgi:hypothetical protein